LKLILLGIDGLSYTSFMKCTPAFLLHLFKTVHRGVVFNKRPQDHMRSWMEVLKVKNEEGRDLIEIAELINIPSNEYFDVMENSTMSELNTLVKSISRLTWRRPAIARITVRDRSLHRGKGNKCQLYKLIDSVIEGIINEVGGFIIFSPFGEPLSGSKEDHEEYGVYLSTRPRPRERDTLKLQDIAFTFHRLITGN